MTGTINPFVVPFAVDRTRETFHFLAYAVSTREFAMMAPLLARGLLPIDARSLLHPLSTWRKALLTLVGKGGIPADPRYVNHPASHLVVETDEPHYTIDGEVAIDYVGRYETLEADLITALARAGVKQTIEIPRTNVTRDRDRSLGYRSYYTPETQALVADWYAPEIALWGYEF